LALQKQHADDMSDAVIRARLQVTSGLGLAQGVGLDHDSCAFAPQEDEEKAVGQAIKRNTTGNIL
jgi:hypothetical protein